MSILRTPRPTGHAVFFTGLLLTLTLTLLATAAHAVEPLILEPGTDIYSLTPHLEVLVDPDRALSFEEVTAEPVAGRFQPAGHWVNLGITRAALWVRFTVENRRPGDSADWVLALDIPPMLRADLYAPSPQGGHERIAGGTAVPLSEAAIRYRGHAYPIRLPPGARKTFHMRFTSEETLVLSLHLLTPRAFRQKDRKELGLLLLFSGVFLALSLWNLMLFVSTRDRTCLYLLLFLLSLGTFLAANFGLTRLFLWPDTPAASRLCSPLAAAMAIIGGMAFCRRFVESRARMPRLDRAIVGSIVLAALLIPVTVLDSSAGNLVVGILGTIVFALALVACLSRVAARGEPARPFYAAMSVGMVGGVLSALMVFGFLGFNFYTFGLGPLSAMASIVFLVLAIGNRLFAYQASYREIFEGVNDAILLYEPATGHFLEVNQRACELYGHPREAWPTLGIGDVMEAPAGSASGNEGLATWTDRALRQGPQLLEATNRRKDGATFWGEVNLIRTHIARRDSLLMVVRDVTDRKKLEEEVLRARKMESVGVLAGGIAHDFNNILTAIWGNVLLAKTHAPPDPQLLHQLEQAEMASERAKDLAHQLLTFARGGAPVKKPLDLACLSRETVGLTLSGTAVAWQEEWEPDLNWVDGDPGQIGQVVHNLVLNAVQAMPAGGRIRITGKNRLLDEHAGLPLEPGRYVELTVEDDGIGIQDEHLSSIFDPYFTTKQKGSGLGLAVVHSIVQRHGGHVRVESWLGKGTAFHVFLPAVEPPAEQPEAQRQEAPPGKGLVLLMDDDEMVRDLGRSILEHLGYEGFVAQDGSEALDLYRAAYASGRPFDLVILDLTVPGGMGGKEAVGKLLEMDPGARVVVSSGYSNDPIMAEHEHHGFIGVIPKPYTIKSMAHLLRNLLNT